MHSLIREAIGVCKVNIANCGNEIANNRENLYSQNNQNKNNATNKYSFNNSNKRSNSGNSNFNLDMILKRNRDCYQNKALIATIYICVIVYT